MTNTETGSKQRASKHKGHSWWAAAAEDPAPAFEPVLDNARSSQEFVRASVCNVWVSAMLQNFEYPPPIMTPSHLLRLLVCLFASSRRRFRSRGQGLSRWGLSRLSRSLDLGYLDFFLEGYLDSLRTIVEESLGGMVESCLHQGRVASYRFYVLLRV